MPLIVPIKDLRKTNEISELCHRSKEPIYVTKNGYGDLVVMSVEAYEKLIHQQSIDRAIWESEKILAEGGEPMEARDCFKMLKEKYFE